MSVAIVQQKLLDYQCTTVQEQDHALKEIIQEIALMVLSQAGFFRVAAFQGDTCLRILYGLERFSEDLDFVLEVPDKSFHWGHYIHNMQEEFAAYGLLLKVKNRDKVESVIKTAFLKADSQGGLLIIEDLRTNKSQLKIKLEIDSNPPQGSTYELKYLDFPLPCSIKTQDLPSLFASKCHALLCRPYLKGRDWYDFIWYVAKQVPINFNLLHHAIAQAGPWAGQNITVTPPWLLDELKIKISHIDWDLAKIDVTRFLKSRQASSLEVWSKAFFLSQLEKLERLLIVKP